MQTYLLQVCAAAVLCSLLAGDGPATHTYALVHLLISPAFQMSALSKHAEFAVLAWKRPCKSMSQLT